MEEHVKLVPEAGATGVYVSNNASPIEENSVSFWMGDPAKVEMLKIKDDGFYVRGEKIEQDEEEAKKVYDAFVTWLKAQGQYLED